MPVDTGTHEEELYTERQDGREEHRSMRAELFGDRRLTAKAYDMLTLAAAANGVIDLQEAAKVALENATLAAQTGIAQKNAALHPFAVDKASKTMAIGEQVSQTLSEDTTQNVLDKAMRQVGETMTQEISRVVMDGLNTLASAIRAEVAAGEESEE